MTVTRKKIEALAYKYRQIRDANNIPGTAEGDWLRAQLHLVNETAWNQYYG